MSISELDADVTKTRASGKDLVVTPSIRVSFGLIFPAVWSEVLQNLDEARKMARVAFDVEANQVVPQERAQECIVEETIVVPVPYVMKEIIEAVEYIPLDGVQKGTVEQITHGLVPQIRKDFEEVTQLIPQELISKCIIEQFTDVLVPQTTVKAVKYLPQKRVQINTVEQVVAVPVPRIREETGQVIQLIPEDRISARNGEQTIDIPIGQIQEKLVGMIQLVLQERISERIGAMLASQIREKLFEVLQLIRQEQNSERIVERFTDVSMFGLETRLGQN